MAGKSTVIRRINTVQKKKCAEEELKRKIAEKKDHWEEGLPRRQISDLDDCSHTIRKQSDNNSTELSAASKSQNSRYLLAIQDTKQWKRVRKKKREKERTHITQLNKWTRYTTLEQCCNSIRRGRGDFILPLSELRTSLHISHISTYRTNFICLK